MLPPASLPSGCCAAVRTPLYSPTTDAARPPACVPWQSRLASSHSSRPARPVSGPTVADRCPLQTGPECGAHLAPAAFADRDRLPCHFVSLGLFFHLPVQRFDLLIQYLHQSQQIFPPPRRPRLQGQLAQHLLSCLAPQPALALHSLIQAQCCSSFFTRARIVTSL